jgi:predicted MFS family arabinose efflux permease
MSAAFVVIPNLSAFIQFNLGYPRERLGLLYLVGGAVSFVNLRLVGALVDRLGATVVGTVGVVALIALSFGWFIAAPGTLPVLGTFVTFMVFMSFRNVPYNTLTSRVPAPAERARFMSIQSAVQHLAAAAGAFASSRLLTELPDQRLVGMPRVATVSIALTALVPLLLFLVERRLRLAIA